jgi:hypothetical protein
LTNASVEAGETVEISLGVTNFQDMLAMQYSLGWDASKLEFQEIVGMNDNISLQPTNFNVNDATGSLAFVWFSGEPKSLADSSYLFTLRFKAIGNVGQNAAMDFSDNPTAPYFENIDGELQAVTLGGSVNILFPCSTSGPSAVNLTDNGDGSVTATVEGGTAPYTYNWSNGQTGQTATGLTPGTYMVSVTDANGCGTSGSLGIVSSSLEIGSVKTLAIFPNPTSGMFKVDLEMESMENIRIELLDAAGRQLETFHTTTTGGQFSFDVSARPNGLYLLEISVGGSSMTRRIVVIH